ncbi:Uncharacterised protein [Mycobacteroides abscessus]|nr:Uncharacterised protein [Mycobacteroides abscessus]
MLPIPGIARAKTFAEVFTPSLFSALPVRSDPAPYWALNSPLTPSTGDLYRSLDTPAPMVLAIVPTLGVDLAASAASGAAATGGAAGLGAPVSVVPA